MKRILVAVDGQNMDENTVSFATYISKLTQSKLTGVFLERSEIREELLYEQSGKAAYIEMLDLGDPGEELGGGLRRKENMRRFRELAKEGNVQAHIQMGNGKPIEEIIYESRFADLVIVNAATTFSYLPEGRPTGFVKSILLDSGCPVIIAPEIFGGIENIDFFYDGSKSALFAMKQFSYLFPELRSKKVKLIYLNNEADLDLNEENRIVEWVRDHFVNDVDWIISQKESRAALVEYLSIRRNNFAVMGAYGKGLLSSFFRPTERREPVRLCHIPIFVSHF